MRIFGSAFFLLAAFGATASAAALCQPELTAEDRAELAASPSHIASDETIAALPAEKKAKLCQSIKTVNELRAHENRELTDSKEASSFYLGPSYAKIFSKALNDYLAKLLASKGFRKR